MINNSNTKLPPQEQQQQEQQLQPTTILEGGIEFYQADWMEFPLQGKNKWFDLLICSQVIEHVDDPSKFMKKLIEAAKTSIISVPYKWPNCGDVCNHKTHKITLKQIKEWTHPYKPRDYTIVKEPNNEGDYNQRIIVIY